MHRRPWFNICPLIILLFFTTSGCDLIQPQTIEAPPSLTAATTPTRTPTQTPTPTPQIIQGTVSIWHSWNESQLPVLVQIIAAFNRNYPNVLFDVLYIPNEYLYERYEHEVRDGGGPTLLMGPAEWGPLLFSSGSLADISSPTITPLLEQLNQSAVGAVRYKGSLIGLPYAMQGIVLFRNKDIMTLAPNTLEELIILAQSATQGQTIGAMLERSFLYAGAHLNGLGGELMDSEGMPAFNTDQGLEWLEMLKLFEQAGPTNYMNDQDLNYFMDGKVGWIIDGTWNLLDIAEAIGAEKLTIDPWPRYKDGHLSGYIFTENFYLNPQAQGDQFNAGLKFIEYFLSPEAQTLLIETGRIPVATNINATDTITGTLFTQAITALAEGTTYPIIPEMENYKINWDIALKSYFEEGLAASEVLQLAYNSLVAILTKEQTLATPTP